MKAKPAMAMVGNRPAPNGLHKQHQMTYDHLVTAIKQYAMATQVQQATAANVAAEKEPRKTSSSGLAKSRGLCFRMSFSWTVGMNLFLLPVRVLRSVSGWPFPHCRARMSGIPCGEWEHHKRQKFGKSMRNACQTCDNGDDVSKQNDMLRH